MTYHTPVLATQVIDTLAPSTQKTFVDCTLGNGGHTLLLLSAGAKVIGIDQDPNNLQIAQNRIESAGFSSQFIPIHANFNQLSQSIPTQHQGKIDGIIFDLGLSKNQQMATDRGFSFNDPQSLDMRLDPATQSLTAEYIINVYPYEQLYKIFSFYAQEKFSKPLAIRIINERQKKPIKTGSRLAEIIRQYYKQKNITPKIDPATKIFMALRIFINDEYENLKSALNQTLTVVKPGGIVCVISFHSGEDRIIKQFIKEHQVKGKISNSSKIMPDFNEISQNPLSRSAILRSYRIV